MLESAETGRHDEILRSVVAHNARRRAQRARTARIRRAGRIAGRLAVPVAIGIGIYALVVFVSGAFGGGKSATHEHTTAAAAVTPAASTKTSSAKPVTVRKPSRTAPARHHTAKITVRRKTAAHPPVTASIASVHHTKTVKHHVEKTPTVPKTTTKKPAVKPAAAVQPVVLAEADASKGSHVTSLDATITPSGVATFTITASRGPAFVEVRLKTSSGPLLTKGTVPKGETITFTNKLLWVDVGTPQNLDLSVNGKTWRPTGSTVVATLSPTGVHR